MGDSRTMSVEDAQRAAAMHKVYGYLLRLAAQKRAAKQDVAGNQAETAVDSRAKGPGMEGA